MNIKRQTFWDSMKLNEWLYLATSLTIDWSTTITTTTTKGRRKTAHDQIPGHSKAVLSLFLQETTMQTMTTTTFDSIEQVQSIDQLFWKQQQNKNNEAKKTRLQNINNNNINFQTANVKTNVRRVEQNNSNNNRKTKWQMTAKWEKTKVVAPLQRKKQLNIIWLWRQQQKQQQHLMNSTYRRQNI